MTCLYLLEFGSNEVWPCHRNDFTPTSNKKTKKHSAPKASTSSASDPDELAALNRRAARFQREHEIERQKSWRQSKNHSSSSTYGTHTNSHPYKSRSGTPAICDVDEPEANGVSAVLWGCVLPRTY